MNEDRNQEIVRRVEAGEAYSTIGRSIGLSGAQVSRVAHQRGAKIPGGPTRPSFSDPPDVHPLVGMAFAIKSGFTGGWIVTKVTAKRVFFYKPEYDVEKHFTRSMPMAEFVALAKRGDLTF